MTSADRYRGKAAEYRARAVQLFALARREANSACTALAASYVRLAEQAERNSHNNVVYEATEGPQAQQKPQVQQQQQPQVQQQQHPQVQPDPTKQ